jgi:hypothetical protein
MHGHDDDEETEDGQRAGALTTAPQQAGQVARRDFAGGSLAITNATTEAVVAAARANMEARWIMAMRQPRNLDTSRQMILAECRRPGFAEVATYSRPVGKEEIKVDGDPRGRKGQWVDTFADGLSIRFAEVALRCMGNMQAKAQTIYDGPDSRIITVTAVDYETNTTIEVDVRVPKTVERKKLRKGQRPLDQRENSYGDLVFIVAATEQQTDVTAASAVSKAMRTAILRLIPGHIQDEAFEICRRVAADRTAKDPAATRNRMLDAFAEFGVMPSAIEQWLGHEIATSTREELLELSRIASGLREREIVWHDALADRLMSRAEPAKPPSATTKAAAPPADQPSPAQPAAGSPAAPPPSPKPSTSTAGKGTSALKGALKAQQQQPKTDPRDAEPAWMSGEQQAAASPPAIELPPDTPPPADGNVYRACAKCAAIIEVPATDAPGGRCYACSMAERDE